MRGELKRLFRSNPLFVAGVVIFAVWILIALFSPLLTRMDPLEQFFADRFQPPSSQYWFGTDGFGRDIFSRIIAGSRISVLTGLLIVLISLVVGSKV